MKFGKELSSQMVQEWQAAYMDYNTLKSLLKDLLIYRQQNGISSSPAMPGGHLRRKLSLYRAFSGLTGRPWGSRSPKKSEDEVILISSVEEDGFGSSYRTTFLRMAEDGGLKELVFFQSLDAEFNKVLKFYKQKVEEAQHGAEDLTKQMDALIALRIRVDKPDVVVLPATVVEKKHGKHHTETIQEVN